MTENTETQTPIELTDSEKIQRMQEVINRLTSIVNGHSVVIESYFRVTTQLGLDHGVITVSLKDAPDMAAESDVGGCDTSACTEPKDEATGKCSACPDLKLVPSQQAEATA